MQLAGSCHCGRVRFTVASRTPYPYRRCYCARCRKTTGGGGYAVAIMGEAATLTLTGADELTRYDSPNGDGSLMETYFCRRCGSHLYNALPAWPQWVYLYAAAIDSPLPAPPETFHIILGEKADWVDATEGANQHHFRDNTPESIEDWHRRHGLYEGA